MQVLKGVVIAMGVAIALGIATLGYVLVQRGGRLAAGDASAARSSASEAARAGSFAPISLGLPEGSRVEQMVVSGDRLVVSILVPEEGQRIVVIDLESGAELGTVSLEGAR